jgi:hypothetical protein
MNDWNPETGIGPKPRNDGPAGSRKDHDRFLAEGLQGQPHADSRSTSGAGKVAMTQILRKRYLSLPHGPSLLHFIAGFPGFRTIPLTEIRNPNIEIRNKP